MQLSAWTITRLSVDHSEDIGVSGINGRGSYDPVAAEDRASSIPSWSMVEHKLQSGSLAVDCEGCAQPKKKSFGASVANWTACDSMLSTCYGGS